jgi:hypothetical protein
MQLIQIRERIQQLPARKIIRYSLFAGAAIALAIAGFSAETRPLRLRGGIPDAIISNAVFGVGATTLECVDIDSDGYGPGPGCTGPDADPLDDEVNTVASWQSKHGTVDALLAARGYTGILRYRVLDPVNGNDGTCVAAATAALALASPCQTWNSFRGNVIAGDVTLVRGGTYAFVMPINNNGTATNPIRIMSYPGELFEMNRTNLADGFSKIAAAYITIDGIKVFSTSNANAFNFDASNNMTFRNVWTHGSNTALRIFSSLIGRAHTNLVEMSYFRSNSATEMLYMGARGNPSYDVTIRRNVIYAPSGMDSGYPAFQWNGRVTNLVVEQNIVWAPSQCFSLLQGVSDSFIRNNLCFGGTAAGLSLRNYSDAQSQTDPNDCTCPEDGICPYDQVNTIIENNIFIRPQTKRNGIAVGSGAVSTVVIGNNAFCEAGSIENIMFRNNIIQAYGNEPLIWFNAINAAEREQNIRDISFHNNLFYKVSSINPTEFFIVGTTASGRISYTTSAFSAYHASLTPNSTIANNVEADPLFVNYAETNWSSPGNNNFHLQAGSPAIGAATTTSSTVDIQELPQTTPRTIGPYAN